MPLNPLIDSLKHTRIKVLECFDVPENILVRKYAHGKWSVREILCHLADAEMAFLWRITRAIAEPGARVEAFDQDAWAARLHYNTRSLEVARNLFDATRLQVLYYLEGVRGDQLDNTVEHSERGTLTLRKIVETLEWHTGHHLAQMMAAREGKPWQDPDA